MEQHETDFIELFVTAFDVEFRYFCCGIMFLRYINIYLPYTHFTLKKIYVHVWYLV